MTVALFFATLILSFYLVWVLGIGVPAQSPNPGYQFPANVHSIVGGGAPGIVSRPD